MLRWLYISSSLWSPWTSGCRSGSFFIVSIGLFIGRLWGFVFASAGSGICCVVVVDKGCSNFADFERAGLSLSFWARCCLCICGSSRWLFWRIFRDVFNSFVDGRGRCCVVLVALPWHGNCACSVSFHCDKRKFENFAVKVTVCKEQSASGAYSGLFFGMDKCIFQASVRRMCENDGKNIILLLWQERFYLYCQCKTDFCSLVGLENASNQVG